MSFSDDNLYAKCDALRDPEWVNLKFAQWTPQQWREYRKSTYLSIDESEWTEEDKKMNFRDESLETLNECRNTCNSVVFRVWDAKVEFATAEERLFIDWLRERQECSCNFHDCYYYYEKYLIRYAAKQKHLQESEQG